MENEHEKPGNYNAWIPAPVLFNSELPDKAKLLFAVISGHTNLRGYCFASNKYLMDLFNFSERTLQRHLKALEKIGAIRIEDGDGGAGRRRIYAGINPMLRNPDKNDGVTPTKMTGVPDKNDGENNKVNNKHDNPPKAPQGAKRARKKIEPKDAPDWKPERFRGFWNYYPRHTSKQAAIKAWDTLRPADELIDRIAEALRRQKATDEWSRGIGIPYASTYLNQARWEDEVEPLGYVSESEEAVEWL